MTQLIPLKNNNYNFSATVSLDSFSYYMRFQWQERLQMFVMEFGQSGDNIFESNIACIVGVQLNLHFLNRVRGMLYLVSQDESIQKPNPFQLGDKVNLYYVS